MAFLVSRCGRAPRVEQQSEKAIYAGQYDPAFRSWVENGKQTIFHTGIAGRPLDRDGFDSNQSKWCGKRHFSIEFLVRGPQWRTKEKPPHAFTRCARNPDSCPIWLTMQEERSRNGCAGTRSNIGKNRTVLVRAYYCSRRKVWSRTVERSPYHTSRQDRLSAARLWRNAGFWSRNNRGGRWKHATVRRNINHLVSRRDHRLNGTNSFSFIDAIFEIPRDWVPSRTIVISISL